MLCWSLAAPCRPRDSRPLPPPARADPLCTHPFHPFLSCRQEQVTAQDLKDAMERGDRLVAILHVNFNHFKMLASPAMAKFLKVPPRTAHHAAPPPSATSRRTHHGVASVPCTAITRLVFISELAAPRGHGNEQGELTLRAVIMYCLVLFDFCFGTVALCLFPLQHSARAAPTNALLWCCLTHTKQYGELDGSFF